jgi:acetylornithine deacetylase/succinyl-diaminopimelate desuccinylase-like protein
MSITTTENLLLEMLRIPSVSGQEVELSEWLEGRLASQFELQRIPVSGRRFSLLAICGQPRVVLVAHVDTVPGNLPVSHDDRFIRGRGSCDNKAAAAAMLQAGQAAATSGQTGFGLLFTVGEEVGCDGARAAAEWLARRGIRPELVVIGEPTGLRPVTAQKGVLSAKLTCFGRAAHSSQAIRDSATEKLIRLLTRLNELCLPETSFNIGTLAGGQAENIVADQAEALVSWRTSLPDLRQRIESVLGAGTESARIEFRMDCPPVDRTRPPFKRYEAPYFTEMRFFKNSVVWGPGQVEDAHTDHEKVSRRQLNAAVGMYRQLLAGDWPAAVTEIERRHGAKKPPQA